MKTKYSLGLVGLLGLNLLLACGSPPSKPVPNHPAAPAPPRADPNSRPLQGPGDPARSKGHLDFTWMANGPSEGLVSVPLILTGLEFQGPQGTWTPVPLAASTVAVDLADPRPVRLAQGAALPPGVYSAFRLGFAADSSVTRTDGSVVPLQIHPAHRNGFPLTPALVVIPGRRVDGVVLLDLAAALRPARPGQPDLLFFPTFSVFRERARTSTLTGTLKDRATGLPLVGADVWAQYEPASGHSSEWIVRRTRTDGQGRYALDLIPPGPVRLVAQPWVGGQAYEAVVRETLSPCPEPQDLEAAAIPLAGAVVGGFLTPAADNERFQVQLLRQDLQSAASPILVRETQARPDPDLAYQFPGVPPGSYRLRVIRTVDTGLMTWVAQTLDHAPFTVTAGGPHRQDLAWPARP